jgi:hypothetical protein
MRYTPCGAGIFAPGRVPTPIRTDEVIQ